MIGGDEAAITEITRLVNKLDRWGKLSQSLQHSRQGRFCTCRITLPSEVLDELPEIDEARAIVGEGPTRDLAESAALLECNQNEDLDEKEKDGADEGLRFGGYRAILNSLRVEKGFVHWGHDVGPEDTPFEAGLSFTILGYRQVYLTRMQQLLVILHKLLDFQEEVGECGLV